MKLYHSDKTGLFCCWFDDMNLLTFAATLDGKHGGRELFNKAFGSANSVLHYLQENGYTLLKKDWKGELE